MKREIDQMKSWPNCIFGQNEWKSEIDQMKIWPNWYLGQNWSNWPIEDLTEEHFFGQNWSKNKFDQTIILGQIGQN